MGGEEAIGASASNDLIRAVVAEGATARTAADKGWLSDEYGLRGVLQEQIERCRVLPCRDPHERQVADRRSAPP